MSTWENAVRDKLAESTGSPLRESLFSEFLSRLDAADIPVAANRAATASRHALLWALAPAAAALAAIILIQKPSSPDNGIRIIQQNPVPVAAVTDTVKTDDPLQPQSLVAYAVTPKSPSHTPTQHIEAEIIRSEEAGTPKTDVTASPEQKAHEEKVADKPAVVISSPFIPEGTASQPVMMKVLPAAGAVAGGGLLAALVIPALGSLGNTSDISQSPQMQSVGPPWESDIVSNPVHSFPLKLGLSTRIPITDRMAITTGLEYSRYTSKFTYSISGDKEQIAQYLGIPVRLDWSIAYNKYFNVYVGAGLSGDCCVAASLGGEKVKKDGFRISFIGAGGIQFNPTRRVGIFLEPEVTWTKPHTTRADIERRPDWSRPPVEDYVMATYRTEHAFVFSLATGLRITLGE